MGFLESLRQIKEAETLRAQEEAKQLREKLKAQAIVAEERRKNEETVRQLQKERRNQALRLRDESGIPQLLKELCRIDGRVGWLVPNMMSFTGDSVHDKITWPHVLVDTDRGTKYRSPENHYTCRYFQIETRYNGEIVFHCNASPSGKPIDLMVSETKWRVDKDILETALGKAYQNPRTEKSSFGIATPDHHIGFG